MPQAIFPRLALASLLTGGLLTALFAVLLVHYRTDLREEIRQRIIGRDAAVLHPVALQQLEESAAGDDNPFDSDRLSSVLHSARLEGILAVALFDAEGNLVRAVPATLLFAELPVEDFLALTQLKPISRYHPTFALERTFAGLTPAEQPAPVLEVLLPLHVGTGTRLAGVARYYIDARPLAAELEMIDRRINRQTAVTLVIAVAFIGLIMTASYLGLRRAQRLIAERNERLIRANFELTLSAKASALGQITSHLLHGLQGSVAGLRAVVAGRDADGTAADWQTAAGYTERMQAMIQETVALLGDSSSHTSYELTGHELAAIIRQRNLPAASQKGVTLKVVGGFDGGLDSHRGGLLCLITNNLVQNALEATAAGRSVEVRFSNGGEEATVSVSDEGPGIPERLRPHLFEPGCTGRPGGTGLGLAISRLLARQIGAVLVLESTGPHGTSFRLNLPLAGTPAPSVTPA